MEPLHVVGFLLRAEQVSDGVSLLPDISLVSHLFPLECSAFSSVLIG